MAYIGKDTKVDTPFDNYRERAEEPGGIRVGRAGAATFFFSSKAQFVLIGTVLSLCMKCDSFAGFAVWAVAVFAMTMLWSVTLRLFVPKRHILPNVIINLIYVILFGIGVSYLRDLTEGFTYVLRSFRNLRQVQDLLYLTPLAISYSIASSGYEGDRPNFNWTVLIPTLTGIAVMIPSSVIMPLTGITKGFASLMLAALVLGISSAVLSSVTKREICFAPPSAYDVFTDVPIRKPYEFGKFAISKAFLAVSLAASAFIFELLVKYVNVEDPSRFAFLCTSLLMGGFLALTDLLPMYGKGFPGSVRDYVRYYEYPAVSALVSIPLGTGAPLPRLIIYMIIVILADSLITGFAVSIPRRLVFSDRSRYFKGAPAILLTISLILMVGTVFFVVY